MSDKTIRAILINLDGVKEITVTTLKDMQEAVGGYIETAHHFDNGDTAFVNEEGLLCDVQYWTKIAGAHQPFAGPILILGDTDDEGDSLPAKSTIAEIKKQIITGERLALF